MNSEFESFYHHSGGRGGGDGSGTNAWTCMRMLNYSWLMKISRITLKKGVNTKGIRMKDRVEKSCVMQVIDKDISYT